jgi:hypothetical protein
VALFQFNFARVEWNRLGVLMGKSRVSRAKHLRHLSASDQPEKGSLFNKAKLRFSKFDPIIIIVMILSFILRNFIPANVYTNTPHDDFLGIQLANNLLNGNWLGSWDNRTMLKPPGYSFYLVICHYLAIEPQVLLHAIYLFIAGYFVWIMKRVFRESNLSRTLSRLSFSLLAFNPMFFSGEFSRIYRSSLNTIFALLLTILVIHFWLLMNSESSTKFLPFKKILKSRKQGVTFFSLCSGLLYAGMVLTRSEGLWILYPSVALLLFYSVLSLSRGPKGNKLKTLFEPARIIGFTLVGFVVPVGIIMQVNYHHYGVNQLENYYSGEFARAFSLWSGVDGNNPNLSFVPINSSQRSAVYQISPTAKQLEEFLETPPNTGWKIFNCQQSSVCDESGPWFTFELRDVATQVFSIDSEVKFQKVFKAIADDIENACNIGEIDCKKPGSSTGTINILDISKRQIVNDLAIYFSSLVNMDQASDITRRDGGSDVSQLSQWDSVVKINRLTMQSDKDLYLVLGDVVSSLKSIYSKIYLVLSLLFLFTILRPRRITDSKSAVLPLLFFLPCTLFLYGGGMALFHSATNISAGNSFYTQPAAPIFLIMLLLALHQLLEDLTFGER